MKDLQPVLVETLKQDPSRYQMWNIDKLNKLRNMSIKIGKKQYTCRHRILSHLRLEPSFPNDVEILRPKVGLELNQILNWLEESFYGKYNFFMSK